MAADFTPAELLGPGDPTQSDGAAAPRSLRPVLLGAMLLLAAIWWLGVSGLGGEIQEAVAHAFPGLAGGCGGG